MSRKSLVILQVSARVKVQAQNWAQNCSGWFITAHGTFRPMSCKCLCRIWGWVDSLHQRTCILQGLDYKSLLYVMVTVITHILFCRIMVILGTFLFLLSKYRDSKDNHKRRITNENDVASSTETPCFQNEENRSEGSLKMFYITVGVKVGKIEAIFWITIWTEVKHLRIH